MVRTHVFFFQAEDGIRDDLVTGVQTCALPLMDGQNETLRPHALGGFAALLAAMIADPAMLVWLDGGTSKKDKPNENFAREFLELFTLGAGNFTEPDLREAARSFTGWVRQDR